jgi:hypothetical protein
VYFTAQENQFQLFNDLLPISVVASLIIEDEEESLARMYRAKYLFDKAVYDGLKISRS